jgi:hypothetical protein
VGTNRVYRWNVFKTYDNGAGNWMLNNDADLFGGVPPSNWTDNNALACHISADKDVQRSLFVQKGYPGINAMVYSEVYKSFSSTDGRVAVVMFRVRNTSLADVVWNVYWRYTCYANWSERASVAVNGTCIGGLRSCPGGQVSEMVALTIPASRTSTVIFVSTSGVMGNDIRASQLAFYNNSLVLPAGLELVDDLETATGDYEQ